MKAVQRSKELVNFNCYLKVTETNLNMCEQSIGIQREDRLSVDVTFNQFLEGYVVLREFLTELSCSIKMRGSLVQNMVSFVYFIKQDNHQVASLHNVCVYQMELAEEAILGQRSAASLATGPVIPEPFISPLGLTITPALSSK